MIEIINHNNGVKELRVTITKKQLEELNWAMQRNYEGIVLKQSLNPLEVHTVYVSEGGIK